MNASAAATALFVWGSYATETPPRPEDQRIIREVRSTPPRGQLSQKTAATEDARKGDNPGKS